MSNKEDAQAVDIIFNRGVRQDLDPHTAPPGSLVSCDNLEFDQLGRIVKRDGFALITKTAITNSYAFNAQVRRFAQAPDGSRIILTDGEPAIYVPSQDKTAVAGVAGVVNMQRAALTGVDGISADQNSGIKFVDTLAFNQWTVYVYIQLNAAGTTYNVYADVIEEGTGSRVFTGILLGTSAGTYPPRLVFAAGSSRVFAIWEKVGGTALSYSYCDFGTQPFTWTAAADLATDTGPAIFDVASDRTNGFVVLMHVASAPSPYLRIYTINGANYGALQWTTSTGATWTPSALALAGRTIGSSANYHLAGYNPATFKLETAVFSSGFTVVNKSTVDPGLSHTKHVRQLAIQHNTLTASLIAFSNYTSSDVSTNPRGHLYTYTMDDTAVATLNGIFYNYSLASRIYATNACLLFARFDDPSGAQNHLLLLDYGSGTDENGIAGYILIYPAPIAHIAPGRVPLLSDNAISSIAGIADLSAVQAGLFRMAAIINVGAAAAEGNQILSWKFEFHGKTRFLSTPCQRGVVLGGGTPLVFDGQVFAEASFYSYPVFHSGNTNPLNVGGSIAQGTYQYRVVWEWCDVQGNLHQSPAAPAITVDMSGASFAAGTNSVQLTTPNLMATRKQSGFGSSIKNPVMAVYYRTLAGGTTFYRVPSGGVNQTFYSGTAMNLFVDTYADASISGNTPLYTTAGGQGLLASTAPPPSISVTTHAQRLWGVDMENAERIWCTRILQPGFAPAYNPALQILIPGAGRINGIAGQDGKLYALATNGIYLATYGDGPDDTGGGSFPSPQLITTTANCQDPRSVLVGQEGIFFTGIDQWGTGIYQIRRGDGQPVSIGKRVRNELAQYPVCRGVVNRTQKSRTEFLFVDSDTSPTKGVILNYHHDYLDEEGVGQWTVTRVNTVPPSPGVALECLGVWDDQSVTADESNNIGWQLANANVIKDLGVNYITTLIETADVRPDGLLGFAQVSGVTMLGTQSAADPIEIELSYDSGFTWPDTYQWTASTESVGQPVIRQRMPQTQKQFDGGSIRVRLTNPTLGGANPGATFFHGITIEVNALGGVARLDSARRA